MKVGAIMWAAVQITAGWKVRGDSDPAAAPTVISLSRAGGGGSGSGEWEKRKKKKEKLQNQRDKLQPPTNAWTRVKAGQPGNFRIISTAVTTAATAAAASRPVKGDMQLGPAH